MSFRGSGANRGIFPRGWFYLVVVLSPTWWIPPLRLRYGRNDIRFWLNCYRFKCTTIPAYAGWRQIAAATPVTLNGKRNVAAMIHRHATPRIQPVWLNGIAPRHVIPREQSESRNLPEFQILPCVGSFSNVEDSSTPLRCGRNDNFGTFLRIRPLFLQHFTPPRGPHQARPGEPASPKGSSCSVSTWLRLNPAGIYPEGFRNGTQAVPHGFADWCTSSTRVF